MIIVYNFWRIIQSTISGGLYSLQFLEDYTIYNFWRIIQSTISGGLYNLQLLEDYSVYNFWRIIQSTTSGGLCSLQLLEEECRDIGETWVTRKSFRVSPCTLQESHSVLQTSFDLSVTAVHTPRVAFRVVTQRWPECDWQQPFGRRHPGMAD